MIIVAEVETDNIRKRPFSLALLNVDLLNNLLPFNPITSATSETTSEFQTEAPLK